MISRRTFVTICVVPVIWWETYWKTFFEVVDPPSTYGRINSSSASD